jgi:hypothetical protein
VSAIRGGWHHFELRETVADRDRIARPFIQEIKIEIKVANGRTERLKVQLFGRIGEPDDSAAERGACYLARRPGVGLLEYAVLDYRIERGRVHGPSFHAETPRKLRNLAHYRRQFRLVFACRS